MFMSQILLMAGAAAVISLLFLTGGKVPTDNPISGL
jgi:hypothetical protein